MHNLAKSNTSFRDASRREDAALLEAAFGARSMSQAHSMSAIAKKAAPVLEVSKRQIEYWLKCDNDMPSWVPKAVKGYMAKVEAAARRIEGRR